MTTHSTRRSAHLVVPLAVALALVFAAPAAAAQVHLVGPLTGWAVVDAEGNTDQGDPDSSESSAGVVVDPETGQLCYSMVVYGIATPTAAHIHEGVEGENGPIVVPLVAPAVQHWDDPVNRWPDPVNHWDDPICMTVDGELLAAIAENPAGYYIDVHNDEYPDGALRGPLRLFSLSCPRLIAFSGEHDEGSDIASVRVGEVAGVLGSFDPGPTAEFELFFGGESVRVETVAVSAGPWSPDRSPSYEASIDITFEAGDEGVWTVVGRNPDVPGCEGSVEITVSAAAEGGGGGMGAATPAPMLPDVSMEREAGINLAQILGLALLALGAGIAAVQGRQQRYVGSERR